MSDSLLLGSLELVDQSTRTPYRVVGDDLGSPTPDTAKVAGVLLDGDRVTGRRSGNRAVNLPVTVTGASRLDVAAKVNALAQIVNCPCFTLTWTPDGGLPVVYDCLRGSFVRARDANVEAAFYANVVLPFDALPFGRSTDPVSISGVGSVVLIDRMDSGSYTTGSAATHSGPGPSPFEGSSYAEAIATVSGASWHCPIGRAVSTVDLSSADAVTVRVQPNQSVMSTLSQATITLVDTHGSTQSGTVTPALALSVGTWTLVSVPVSGMTTHLAPGRSDFDWTAVNAWTATVNGTLSSFATSPALYFDDLEGVPFGTSVGSTSFGQVLTVPGLPGTARMPVNIAATLGGSTFSTLLLHAPPSTQDSDLEILIPLTSGAGTVAPTNARYDGTYTVVVFLNAAGSGSRTIDVNFNNDTGTDAHSPTTSTVDVSAVVTGSQLVVAVGSVTLPQAALTADNPWGALHVLATSTGSDTFLGVALCDTEGQTVLLTGLDSWTKGVWVDEPTPTVGIGQVYAAPTTGRDQAYSVLGLSRSSGGPMVFEPGDNRLLVASRSGVPSATVTGYPRWIDERTV